MNPAWLKSPLPAASPLSLSLIMIVSFCISFGLMWRQRQAVEPSAPELAVSTAQRPPPGRVASAGAPPPASTLPQAPSAAARAAVSVSRTAEAEPTQADQDGGEPPVMFALVKTTAYVREEGGDGPYRVVPANEVVVTSLSDKPLSVTVIDLHLPTMEAAQSEFTLPKSIQKHVGVEQGLKMLSGDQITLRTPPFKDIVQMIP